MLADMPVKSQYGSDQVSKRCQHRLLSRFKAICCLKLVQIDCLSPSACFAEESVFGQKNAITALESAMVSIAVRGIVGR